MRWKAGIVLFVAALGVEQLAAQTVDISGTWKLSRTASQITSGAGLAGLERGGTPNSLYVTHAANGSVIIGSDHNQGTARAYMIGGETVIPAAANATVKVRTRVDGRSLVVESTEPASALREVFSLSADGQMLTIVVTQTTAGAARTTTLVYAKTLTESPCTEWPTDCSR